MEKPPPGGEVLFDLSTGPMEGCLAAACGLTDGVRSEQTAAWGPQVLHVCFSSSRQAA